ncbi:PorP/SprF family type IX secretion system membrane protein [Chryseolinea soli]|uniref:Type IX secretion system membrane protein PorP/SprF n=1 Tax=Chryseolinea soli TaxID=2321403 RepID=A0A385SWF3_9BACT|nr:PorP/SprF family type IX secretion system membrane protein [Chryseolinea soli]AYB34050.1 type IX secretion system membrane protein PorP/SprF [Chryseolinea soli]
MGRFLSIVLLCLTISTAVAQYVPNSSQGFQFMSMFNPAFAGVEGYQDLKLGYRYQWAGFGKNAPKFINLAYTIRLKEPLDLNMNSTRTGTVDPEKKNEDAPGIKKSIQALGINVFNENIGVMKRLGGGVTYAFHYPVAKKVMLSAGLSVLIDNTKIDVSKLYLGINAQPDQFYQDLVANGANHTNLNVRAGIMLYSPRYYFGVSYLPLVNSVLKTSEAAFSDSFYKGSLQAGVSLPVSPAVDIKPSVLLLMQQDNKFLIDYNVKIYLEQKLWFGVTYRDVKSIVGTVGFNLNEKIGASYSYEVSSGGMQQFSSGSHELVLALRLNNTKRLSQQIW